MEIALDMHMASQQEYLDIKKSIEVLSKYDKPFTLSLVPYGINRLSDDYKKKLSKLLEENKEKITIAQHGLSHRCKKCEPKSNLIDMYHEEKGLWCSHFPKKQLEDMLISGKELLEQELNVSIEGYVPANHLFPKNEPEVLAYNNYKFMTNQACIKLEPYKTKEGLLLLPESKLFHTKSNVLYFHMNELLYEKGYKEAIEHLMKTKDIINISSISPSKPNPLKIRVNEIQKFGYKLQRDFFNILKNQKLYTWAYSKT